ncbi:MAG: dihydrolipoamide acyltransferase [Alphaproteobacteria bacterium]|nr:dihydrolipoamide acyltransferase [Alphaproteobacteria bacterium]
MAKIMLKLPKLAVSMQEGTLREWFVESGAQVTLGQPIYALETEKTTVEIESPFEGTFTCIGEVGETYKVGDPIAEILQ